MLINGEQVYLFNPWQVSRWKDEEICEQVNELIKLYNPNEDTMYGIAKNIEVMANINYLYGEMISRLTSQYSEKKLRNNARESKLVYQLRNDWVKANKDKAPAISYFEAQAYESVQDDRKEELDKLSLLTRFKYAYESMEAKMNALKKKLESIKYEEFNNGA